MQNQRDKHHPQGRAISLMEMISVALGYDQVYTDIQFVHIPKTPLAERPAFDRPKPIWKLQAEGAAPRDIRRNLLEDLDCEQVIPAYEI